jgi:ABC-type transport system involved in multi-copper enzyme maturation permease subunit
LIELRAAARRWQTYAVRVGFIVALAIALTVVWNSKVADRNRLSVSQMAMAGETFYYALVGTQLTLILLAAPAATAGAVCIDKSRGCLLQLLVTDLSSAEIVLGKLAANLTPVFSLLLAGLPVLGAATLIGGIEPWTVFGALFISVGVTVFGCSLALLLSVWAGKTHEVLVASYAVLATALLACPVWVLAVEIGGTPGASAPGWLRKANPYWLAFAPYSNPFSSVWVDPLLFFAGCVATSAVFMLLAIFTVRRAAIRYGAVVARPVRAQGGRAFGLWPAPSLDGNPVLWNEWRRRQPSRWLRAIWFLFRIGAVSVSAIAVGLGMFRFRFTDLIPITNAFIVVIGLLLFSVSAVTSLTEERVRGSLDVLLTTPLSTRSIVKAKWWGTFRTVPLLAILPAINLLVPTALMSILDGSRFSVPLVANPARANPGTGMAQLFTVLVALSILSYGAAVTSVGLALATWIRRPGRAAALCTATYVVMTVAPIVTSFLVFGRQEHLWPLMGSPFFGVGATSEMVMRLNRAVANTTMIEDFLGPLLFWIVVYLAVAVALYVLTVRIFDRCLGRARQRPSLEGRVVEYEAAIQ